MKRSEMLFSIEEYVSKMWPELDVIDVAHFADALLGMQESAGMLPPPDTRYSSMQFDDLHGEIIYPHQWSPEDA